MARSQRLAQSKGLRRDVATMSESGDIQIRRMEPLDVEAVARIDADTHADTTARLEIVDGRLSWVPVPLSTTVVRRRDVGAFVREPVLPWDEAFVAEVGGAICGFAAFGMQEWNRRALLWHFYVDRQVRERGIGRALVERLLERARSRGARQLWLETQSWNTPALAAYEHLGFALVGFDCSLYANPPSADTAVYLARACEKR